MKHLLVPIICLLLLSCSKDDNHNTDNNTPSVKTSLPVKVTTKDANGTLTRTATYNYDSQNRLKTVKVVDANTSLNFTTTISYENGKITSLVDYDATSMAVLKFVYFYDGNGIKNEEFYSNGVLNYTYEWYYRPDGGKERRRKNTSGVLSLTEYYRFSATGNLERKVEDNVNPLNEDIENTFSNYDNKLRTIAGPIGNVIHYYLLGFPGVNLPAPNNPLGSISKNLTSGTIVSETYEYTYNNKNQVTVMKIKDAGNVNIKAIRTIEYQEF
ncbi:hypothetical protein [Flavobacterium chungangense]|uniref:DUF4595 domain-containing protein n=1 Tax=Flavobacterium chungangense TaxID=554283 RepID=A0A6V6Z7D1_9FLAO|nr:hypothetical protein [Flavobacterium chungangense]CAD0007456.1 hypothetical protein FLACHUCJ7_03307 [Flavobacterium chungangense]